MVRTKPDSEHHQQDLKDYETIIPPLDFKFSTKPNIEHHEDNNTRKNHKSKLTQIQRQHIHDSKQIMSHLGHSNRSYRKSSTISIDKKAFYSSWLKLSSVKTLSHTYVIIDKTKNPFLPVVIYKITPFDNFSGHSQILKDFIMSLITLSPNLQEIKTNKQVLGGIMKVIGFCPGFDSGKSAGV
ncbi:hypothetical protein O181_132147 [Austropuccinia psidii MF-1]|uniref:Uncharacterized protein n=1 Tax=Austropuccinia psidii MF-1 TaxID=1389203 RepID=A0A9Q3QDQ6_9BASI|nr:hypothetical protein [Austropuccinia psidii MF-1]